MGSLWHELPLKIAFEIIDNRFELVLAASQRTREIELGSPPHVLRDNDKNTVISLREIAEKHVTLEELKESLVKRFQKSYDSDEADEHLLSMDSEDEEAEESQDEAELLATLREAMGDDLFKTDDD